jgi:hypothetical protein
MESVKVPLRYKGILVDMLTLLGSEGCIMHPNKIVLYRDDWVGYRK